MPDVLDQLRQQYGQTGLLPASPPNEPAPQSGLFDIIKQKGKDILGDMFGGPSWSDQATELRGLRQQGHKMTDPDMMERAASLPGGFTGTIKAYHGSPHLFPPEPGAPLGRFKDEAIGTGEGNQAYSHGHYFAEDPKVSMEYFGDEGEPMIGGKEIDFSDPTHAAAYHVWNQGSKKEAKDLIKRQLELGPSHHNYETNKEILKVLNSRGALPKIDPAGYLYDVELSPDIEDLLHWDKPLHEQSPKVQEALGPFLKDKVSINNPTPELWYARSSNGDMIGRIDKSPNGYGVTKYGVKGPESLRLYDSIENAKAALSGPRTGEELYHHLVGKHGSPESASAALHEAGIPGVRYLDGFSRMENEGTHNVVLFDPAQATIMKRTEANSLEVD